MIPSEHRDKPGYHPDRPFTERMVVGMGYMIFILIFILLFVFLLSLFF